MSNNYKMKKVTPKDIVIKLENIFGTESVPVIGVRPAYVYENNKPTEKIEAYYYDLSLNGKYLPVKVYGEKQIEDLLIPENGIYVEFENLVIKFYSSNNFPCLCASADKIRIP